MEWPDYSDEVGSEEGISDETVSDEAVSGKTASSRAAVRGPANDEPTVRSLLAVSGDILKFATPF